MPLPRAPRGALAALAALLAVLALLALAGCGSDAQPGPAPCPPCPEPEPRPGPAVAPPPAAAPGRLDAILARGSLRCGVRDAVIPFSFADQASGQIIGFEPDLCRALAQELGVRAELVTVTPSTRLARLLAGDIDCIAATLTHHHGREADLDFSITYFMDGQKLLTRRGSPVRSPTDLAARRVGVVEDTFAAQAIREAQPECSPVSFPGYAEAFLALKRGQVDAISADATILLGLKNSDQDPAAWSIAGDYITDEPFALGLPQNDSALRDRMNLALQRLWLSGEYMKLYNRWFGPHTKYYLPTTWRMEIWPGVRKKS